MIRIDSDLESLAAVSDALFKLVEKASDISARVDRATWAFFDALAADPLDLRLEATVTPIVLSKEETDTTRPK